MILYWLTVTLSPYLYVDMHKEFEPGRCNLIASERQLQRGKSWRKVSRFQLHSQHLYNQHKDSSALLDEWEWLELLPKQEMERRQRTWIAKDEASKIRVCLAHGDLVHKEKMRRVSSLVPSDGQ